MQSAGKHDHLLVQSQYVQSSHVYDQAKEEEQQANKKPNKQQLIMHKLHVHNITVVHTHPLIG